MTDFRDTFGRPMPKLRPLPKLRPITAQVADVSDAERFPEINAAIDWARKQREAPQPPPDAGEQP